MNAIFFVTSKNYFFLQSPLPKGVTAPHAFTNVEYDGFIDLGKQLSILHSLLSECITKVTPTKLKDIDRLHCILERVGYAMAQPHPNLLRQIEIPNDSAALHNYHSLQRNVFRYVYKINMMV